MAIAEITRNEMDLKTRIATLREDGADNPTLIIEAIKGIFYMLDEDPTQARVLEFVRFQNSSPSNNTIQKYLTTFKADIRQRLRIKMQLPDIPPDAVMGIEDAMARVVEACQRAAMDSLNGEREAMRTATDEIRRACEREVLEAKISVEGKMREIDQLRLDLVAARDLEAMARDESVRRASEAAALLGQNDELNRTIVDLRDERSKLAGEMRAMQDSYEGRLTALEEARKTQVAGLEAEITKLRNLLTSSDDRNLALKLDLQREVDRSKRQEDQLAKANKQLTEQDLAHRSQMRSMNEDLKGVQIALAESRGKNEALAAENAQLVKRNDLLLNSIRNKKPATARKRQPRS